MSKDTSLVLIKLIISINRFILLIFMLQIEVSNMGTNTNIDCNSDSYVLDNDMRITLLWLTFICHLYH